LRFAKQSFIFDPALSEEELRGFSRTVAEIEWLTVSLVLLYLQSVMERADQALYESKTWSRNRVSVASNRRFIAA
jgi:hypothetical protein